MRCRMQHLSLSEEQRFSRLLLAAEGGAPPERVRLTSPSASPPARERASPRAPGGPAMGLLTRRTLCVARAVPGGNGPSGEGGITLTSCYRLR